MITARAMVVFALIVPVDISRAAADKTTLGKELQQSLKKPRPELVIDITVMELPRDRIVFPDAEGGKAGSFAISVPGESFTVLASDGDAKILQNRQIRAFNYEKSTVKIGDRVPLVTGSWRRFGDGAPSPVETPQFRFMDVGVKMDITPQIQPYNEVALRVALDISSITGSETVSGIPQPIISQRRLEYETVIADGDVNILGGVLEQQETQSLIGYPWIRKIPILQSLFGQDDRELRRNEILFVVTPHILLR